jgi:hypothetical protein
MHIIFCKQATEKHHVQTIVYLSCGFASFTRDFDALVDSGRWRAAHSEAFIFFPGADHIETLAVFQRAVEGGVHGGGGSVCASIDALQLSESAAVAS